MEKIKRKYKLKETQWGFFLALMVQKENDKENFLYENTKLTMEDIKKIIKHIDKKNYRSY